MKFLKQISRTSAEKKLAKALDQKKITYIQNQMIEGYEIDFWLPDYRLIIEVDGYSHLSGDQKLLDAKKNQRLVDKGFIILRFDNQQIYEHLNQCLNEIKNIIQKVKNFQENKTINDGWKEVLKQLKFNESPAQKRPQTIEEIFLRIEDPPQ